MHGTKNRDAFKLYLEAERLFTVVDEVKMAESRAKFETVTRMDPEYARAWGWRSYTQVRSVLRGWLDDSKMGVAEGWAREGVRLDEYDFATHWDLAFYLLNNGDHGGAIDHYRIGIDLYDNETDLLDRKPGILAEAAEGYLHAGDPKTAITLLLRATKIPDWYRWNLGFAYYQDKQTDEAIDVLGSMRSRPGDWSYVPDSDLFMAVALYRKAQALQALHADEAARMMETAIEKIRIFRSSNAAYSLGDCLNHRSRFKDKKDENYWFEPLQDLWNKSEK
ncbi:MAG: hypothetical protein U1E67_24210 [Hyphomicrobiales bacterium]